VSRFRCGQSISFSFRAEKVEAVASGDLLLYLSSIAKVFNMRINNEDFLSGTHFDHILLMLLWEMGFNRNPQCKRKRAETMLKAICLLWKHKSWSVGGPKSQKENKRKRRLVPNSAQVRTKTFQIYNISLIVIILYN